MRFVNTIMHDYNVTRLWRGALVVLLVLGGFSVLWADDEQADNSALDPLARFSPASYGAGWLTSDRDGDGVVDYAVKVDERGYKIREAMDYNFDGHMDDFYFYSNNVLQREEVDSNYDQRVDIWIYMWRGVYVRKWERDTDFDGVIDLERDYDEPRE